MQSTIKDIDDISLLILNSFTNLKSFTRDISLSYIFSVSKKYMRKKAL